MLTVIFGNNNSIFTVIRAIIKTEVVSNYPQVITSKPQANKGILGVNKELGSSTQV